eukprot:m.490639 g.490639  ORF g.490639 m.490639 type:complete len:124 (-) comp100485_c0_seq1:16-387(-)
MQLRLAASILTEAAAVLGGVGGLPRAAASAIWVVVATETHGHLPVPTFCALIDRIGAVNTCFILTKPERVIDGGGWLAPAAGIGTYAPSVPRPTEPPTHPTRPRILLIVQRMYSVLMVTSLPL